MERFLKQQDKESMKMVMLKHEETFKEQVYELHRLYRIQKFLMNSIRRNGPKAQPLSSNPHEYNFKLWDREKVNLHSTNYHYRGKQRLHQTVDLELPVEDYIRDGDQHVMVQFEQECNFELTLGRRCNPRKKYETSVVSDFGPSFSSSSTDSSATKKTDGVETLEGHNWGPIQMREMNISSQSEPAEEQARHEGLNQAPWLFHDLNLNP